MLAQNENDHVRFLPRQDLADYVGIEYGPLKRKRRAQRNWKKAKALAIFAAAAELRRRQTAAQPVRSPTLSSVASMRASQRASTQASEDLLSREGADQLSPRRVLEFSAPRLACRRLPRIC